MTTLDAIGTRIQFFCLSGTDLEAAQLHQSEVELMLSGMANTSLVYTWEMLDVKVQLTPADGSSQNVRRLQIWALSILPPAHLLHKNLEDHYNDM